MDFFSAADSPIEITIDGKPYQLKRFLLPELKAWSASIRRKTVDEATAHFDADDKARFLLYFNAPPIDVPDLISRATTSDGAEYVVDAVLKTAGVPDDIRKGVINSSDPLALAALAGELTISKQVSAMLAKEGDDKSPLAGPTLGSDGSPETSPAMMPASAPPTPAPTPTA